jgi:hypothetical protein
VQRESEIGRNHDAIMGHPGGAPLLRSAAISGPRQPSRYARTGCNAIFRR